MKKWNTTQHPSVKPSSTQPSQSQRVTQKIASSTVKSQPSPSSLKGNNAPTKPRTTHGHLTPFIIASHLVEQFNHYRHLEILSRIKRCDPNMKLNEMCETYAFDNHTYALFRDSDVEFPFLQNVYDALVDRLIVEKLRKMCSPGRWCLNNLTKEDIQFTFDIIRQRGRSFCSLAKCHHRLAAQATACPQFLSQVRFLSEN